MRKIIILSMITLDGVMQAPGGVNEDTSGDFQYGGWVAPYFDNEYSSYLDKQLRPADLLFGKKTYEIFAGYWPHHPEGWPSINASRKYVLADELETNWENTVLVKSIQEIKDLKELDGPDIQVHGSAGLIQSLLKENLIDELWLKIHPITLGGGKKLFAEGTMPMAFELIGTYTTPSGVIMANYRRSGTVETGNIT